MSLLMDALKRADQVKRAQGDKGAAGGDELTLEPVTLPEAAFARKTSPLPDLNSNLEAVEAGLQATADETASAPPPQTLTKTPSPAQKPGTTTADARAAAQNVLATAAAYAAKKDEGADSNTRIIAIIAVGVLAAGAIGTYFFLQLQSISQRGSQLTGPGFSSPPQRPIPQPPPPLTVAAPALPPAAAEPKGPPLSDPKPLSPAKSDEKPHSAEVAVQRTTKAGHEPAAKIVSRHRPAPARTVAPLPNPSASSAPTASPPGDGLLISSQSHESAVMRAYEALQAGRFTDAKAAYAQALRADARDVDALLGLATLARRDGDHGLASEYYERVLRSEPRNAGAHAGLIALQGGSDPVQTESRLKSLLSLQNSDPNATSALSFALGNLYAGQRRWSEAQQAYFRAHTADAGNPDTLYNLAISLEHLGQKALARQFYEQAIKAGRQRSAAFDPAQAEQRLAALAR